GGGAGAPAAQALTRGPPHSGPALTRYAVDQLAHGVVLDVGKAESRGWTARRSLADHLSAVRNSGT
ncbi:hypothetical protein ACFW9F_26660, partial [Streptomyces sp. NPDC059506]